jgi:hypothetical protein
MPTQFPRPPAEALVARLDLSLDGVCLACLSFVSFAIDDGDPREIARQVRRLTPDLWADGLDAHAFAALRAASDRGIPYARAALEELERLGPRSSVARAIVLRLGHELARRSRRSVMLDELVRESRRRAPPELN